MVGCTDKVGLQCTNPSLWTTYRHLSMSQSFMRWWVRISVPFGELIINVFTYEFCVCVYIKKKGDAMIIHHSKFLLQSMYTNAL